MTSDPNSEPTDESETAVDDVRRVREALHRESGGDIRKHIAESNRLLAERAESLGLKLPRPAPGAVTGSP